MIRIRSRHARAGWLGAAAATALVLTSVGSPAAAADSATVPVGGSVTTTSGTALPQVSVTVLDARTGAHLATTVTGTYGKWHVTAPTHVAVRIRFDKPGYLRDYADNRPDARSATIYTFWPGTTPVLPRQRLVKGATVTGMVLSQMDPIDGVLVGIYNADTGTLIKSVMVGYDSRYRISGLPPVRIKVRATKPGYLQAFANGVHSWAAAATFRLHEGEVLTQTWDSRMRLYLDLTPGGQISGQVLGLDDNPANGYDDPLPGVQVTARDAASGQVMAMAETNGMGSYYLLGIVDAGPVVVSFSKSGWVTSWARNKPTRATADRIRIDPGQSIDLGVQDVRRAAP